MSAVVTTRLETPDGFRSREAARFFWQMEDQRRGLLAAVRDLGDGELHWQIAPGTNTIAMLLAHVAYAEAHLVQVGVLGEASGHAQDVIGFGEEDEGMPLAPGAPPSPALLGRPLAFFTAALDAARAHTRAALERLGDEDLARTITRPPRPDGTVRVFDVGWVIYHLLEHEAGHRGQVQLLRHLHRERAGLWTG
jgi:uncharacterized damage-inducible protein DinB